MIRKLKALAALAGLIAAGEWLLFKLIDLAGLLLYWYFSL